MYVQSALYIRIRRVSTVHTYVRRVSTVHTYVRTVSAVHISGHCGHIAGYWFHSRGSNQLNTHRLLLFEMADQSQGHAAYFE